MVGQFAGCAIDAHENERGEVVIVVRNANPDGPAPSMSQAMQAVKEFWEWSVRKINDVKAAHPNIRTEMD